MQKSRFTEPQAEIGVAVLTVCRAYGISTKWRAKYGGMDVFHDRADKDYGGRE